MVTHYEGELIKQKLYDMSLIDIWSGLRPPKLTLWSRGAWWGSGASAVHFSGGRSPYRTPNPDLEGPGPNVSFSRRFYKIKVVVNVPYSA